ncbi:MAG: hypothetical protein ACK53F_05115, partial [Betaproteobacteria bacterium]
MNETRLVAFPVFGSIKPPLVVVNLIAVPAGITLPRLSTTVNVTFWVGLLYVAVGVHAGKSTSAWLGVTFASEPEKSIT